MAQGGTIKVGVRMRPLIDRELNDPNSAPKWKCYDNKVVRVDAETYREKKFEYDNVFDSRTSNVHIFEEMVKPLVEKAVDGFNATVFAYGQTSSGKTHTMMGTNEEKGIVQLCLDHIFTAIDNSTGQRVYLLGVSFLEVYNEKVQDLLCPSETSDLKITEDKTCGPIVDCKTEMVSTPQQMLDLLERGNRNKAMGETKMNDRSSRSHTIFRICIESQDKSNKDEATVSRCSQINLVDLAGSERASQTQATGQRFKEGCAINRSLLHLGVVVQKLSENKNEFIDYRTSKLTRILQPSLSGNANIAIICNITSVSLEQTNSTLLFASRAKIIEVAPHLNELVDEATLIRRHTKKIKELEMKLKDAEQIQVRNQSLEKEMEMLKQMLVVSSKLAPIEPVPDERERALRRQTWGGGGILRRFPLQSCNMLPEFPMRSDSTDPDNSAWDLDDNLSTEEQPSTMSSASESSSARSSLSLTPARIQFDSASLRQEILENQRNTETPKCVLRKKIALLESKVAELSNNVNTSPKILQERLSEIGQIKTPISVMKNKWETNKTPGTPREVLREYLKTAKENCQHVEQEYQQLRKFTILEQTVSCQEHEAKIVSLERSLKDYEDMYRDLQRKEAEQLTENRSMNKKLNDVESTNISLKKELDTNKQWYSKSQNQQLQWKNELVETKKKLEDALANPCYDWQEEKLILKQQYELKISELQATLNESWKEQEAMRMALEEAHPTVAECENCDSLREKMFFKDQEIENFKMEILGKHEAITFSNNDKEQLKEALALSNRNLQKLEMHLQHREESFAKDIAALKNAVQQAKIPEVKINNQDLLEKLAAAEEKNKQLSTQLAAAECKSPKNIIQSISSDNDLEYYKKLAEELQQILMDCNAEKDKLESEMKDLKIQKEKGVFEFQHDSITYMGHSIEIENELKHKIEELEGEVTTLKQERAEFSDRFSAAGDADMSRQQILEQERRENEKIYAQLVEKLKTIEQQGLMSNLAGSLDTPGPQTAAYIENYIEDLETARVNLQSKIAEIMEEKINLITDNKLLTSQLEEAKQAIEEFKNDKTTSAMKMTMLKENIQTTNSSDSDNTTLYASKLIKEIMSLDSTFTSENLEAMNLNDLQDLFMNTIMRTQGEVFSKLQNQIQNINEKYSSSKLTIEEKQINIDSLCKENENLQTMLQNLKAKCEANDCNYGSQSESDARLWKEKAQQLEQDLDCMENQLEQKASELNSALRQLQTQAQEFKEMLGETQSSAKEELQQVSCREAKFVEQNTQLEHNLQKMRELASGLEQEITQSKNENHLLQQKIVSLTEELQSAKLEISGLTTKLDDVKTNIQNSLTRTENVFSEQVSSNRISELELEKLNANSRICELEAKADTLVQQVERLSLNLQHLEDEKLSALEEQEVAKRTIVSLETTCEECRLRIVDLEVCLKTEQETLLKLKLDFKHADEIHKALYDLEQKYKEESVLHANTEQRLKKDILDANNCILELKEREDSLRKNCEIVTDKYHQLELENNSFQREHVNCKNVISTMETKLQSKICEYETLLIQFNSMSNDFDEQHMELQKLRDCDSRLKQLEQEHAHCKQLIEELDARRRNNKKDAEIIQNLNSDLSLLQCEFKKLEDMLDVLKTKNEKLEDEVIKWKKSFNEVENFNQELKGKLHEQDTKFLNLQSELDDIRVKDSAIISLQEQLQLLQNKYQEAEAEVNLAYSNIQKSEKLLATQENEFLQLSSKVSMLESDLTAANTIINTISSERDTLKQKLSESTTSNDDYIKKLAEAEDEFQEMLESYKDISEKRRQFEGEAYRLELQVKRMTNQILDLEENLAKEVKKNVANSGLHQLQQEHTALQQKLQATETLLANLEQQCKEKEDQIKRDIDTIGQLRRDFADTRGELAVLKRHRYLEDLPHKEEAEAAKKQLQITEKKLTSIKSELRNLQASQLNTTFQECSRCGRTAKTCQSTQTEVVASCNAEVQAPPDNNFSYARDGWMPSSGIVETARLYGMKQQLEDKEKEIVKLQEERILFKQTLSRRNRDLCNLRLQYDKKGVPQLVEILMKESESLKNSIDQLDSMIAKCKMELDTKESDSTTVTDKLYHSTYFLREGLTKRDNLLQKLIQENKENSA